MLYENLTSLLRKRLSWIADTREFQSAEADWGNEVPGPHVVYGDVLVPVLIKLLREAPDDPRLIQAFAFLEEMVNDPDQRISEVAVVSVLEGLQGDKEIRERGRMLMGLQSLRFSKQLEADWERGN